MKSIFFVVGAQRCGTTSLHHYLTKHPQICMGSKKEIHYYSVDGNYAKGKDWYLSKFKNCTEAQITGDSSPLYMYLDSVPARIVKDYKNAKLIFILRNPIERAWSHYSLQLKKGIEFLSFEEAIRKENSRIEQNFYKKRKFSYLDRGKYILQIKRYLAHFSKEQMLFIFSKDLKNNPNKVMNTIFKFLEIEQVDYQNITKIELNKNETPRYKFISFIIERSFLKKIKYIRQINQKFNMKYNDRKMKSETINYLAEYFSEYNQSLKDFLGIEKLNW